MTSVKLFARQSDTKRDGKVKVYLQLIHQRKPKYIDLDIFVTAEAFNFTTMRCTPSHDQYLSYNSKLIDKEAIAAQALLSASDFRFSPEEMEDHIKRKLKIGGGPATLQSVADEMIEINNEGDGESNAAIIANVVKWFNTWNDGNQTLSSIDYKKLLNYKAYLIGTGLSNSTVSNYLRTLRAVFNYAIATKQFPQELYPFKRGLIPASGKGSKKKFDVSVIYELATMKFDEHQRNQSDRSFMELVADTTLLQFYLCGCDLIEIVQLKKKENITGNRVHFKRHKTRKKDNQPEVQLEIPKQAWKIINKYDSKYLVPVCEDIDIRTQLGRYKTRRRNFNRSLAIISERIGLEKPLTCKSVRYIWNTTATNLRVDREVRMRAQGHKIGGVDEAYMSEFDIKIISSANAKVIKKALGKSAQ